MTKTKLMLMFVIISAILIPSIAFAQQSDWRTACNINNPIDNLMCAVDHLEFEINLNIANIAALNATQILQQIQIDNLESDVSILQGNVTSIDTRLSTTEAHVDNHHTTIEPQVGILTTNVTSLQATIDAQAIQITELTALSEHRVLQIVELSPYKNGVFTNVVVYTIKPLIPVQAALEISIYDPNDVLNSVGGCGGQAVLGTCDKSLSNAFDGTWKVVATDLRTNTSSTEFFELIDANLPTQSPLS